MSTSLIQESMVEFHYLSIINRSKSSEEMLRLLAEGRLATAVFDEILSAAQSLTDSISIFHFLVIV